MLNRITISIFFVLVSFYTNSGAAISKTTADSTANARYASQFGINYEANALFYDGFSFITASCLARSGLAVDGGCGYNLTYPALAVTTTKETDTLAALDEGNKVCILDTMALSDVLAVQTKVIDYLEQNVEGPAGVENYEESNIINGSGLKLKTCGNTITYQLPQTGPVQIKLYNLKGQLVQILADGEKAIGAHQISWDGRDQAGRKVSSGVYLVKLTASKQNATAKMVFVK